MRIRVRKNEKKIAVAMMALGAFAASPPRAAHADDTAAQIRLLKKQLKQLEQRVAEQGRKQKEAQERLHQAAAHPGPAPYLYPVGIGVPAKPGPGGLTGAETAIRGLPTLGPSTLYFKGITITPGGFVALESVTRSAFLGSDIGSPPLSGLPYSLVPSSHSSEFRFSARQSRLSILMQGDVDPVTHLGGYFETDFLGAAQTANSNESNSYNLRMRHIYGTVDNDFFGAHLLAGQTWSLATMNTIGIIPRKEDTPLTIDAQYVPGFVWQRTPQIRLVKDFDKTLWFALSAENPATTIGGTAPALLDGGVIVNGVVGTAVFPQTGVLGGSLFNSANSINLSQMPDIVGKVAWDPTIADRHIHMEAFGIFRQFTDRVIYPYGSAAFPYGSILQNHNNQTTGEGVGGSILVPIVPKTLDVQFSGLTGRGIGRYGTSGFPDVTYNVNGNLAAIPETMLLAGAIWHAFPELTLYAYAGEEFQSPSYGFSLAGTHPAFGWGNPAFINTSCNVEFASWPGAACSGNPHRVRQVTAGFWDNVYKGPFGRLTGGLQYSYTQKAGFNGFGGAPARNESMFLTSLRYYPF